MVAEAFTNDDFIYTTAWLGTKLHRMRLFMGLQGFSEKQKIAAHHFWEGVMLKMRGPHGYVHSYPKSFEEMEAFVDRFEARGWPQTESGNELAEYVIDQFNEACLPKPLWGVGRQLILTFQAKHIRDLHRMGNPNPIASQLIKLVLKTKIWLEEKVLPDPKVNRAERARFRGDIQNQHREPPMVASSACPFHAAQRALRTRIGSRSA